MSIPRQPDSSNSFFYDEFAAAAHAQSSGETDASDPVQRALERYTAPSKAEQIGSTALADLMYW